MWLVGAEGQQTKKEILCSVRCISCSIIECCAACLAMVGRVLIPDHSPGVLIPPCPHAQDCIERAAFDMRFTSMPVRALLQQGLKATSVSWVMAGQSSFT